MLPDAPVTRLETYLARLAGQDVSIPDTPITRTEEYLDYIIRNGGGVPAPNAGAHNAIFRGANLGATYTQAQADAIDSGTFDNLFVGDYWEMPWGESETPIKFRIAGFDTYYNMGSPRFNSHHVVIVPDNVLAIAVMNANGGVVGGYVGCNLKTDVLPGILSSIEGIFGAGNILSRKTYLSSGLSSFDYVNSKLDLMSECQLRGIRLFGSYYTTGERASQLPLFNVWQHFILSNESYWLQDVTGNNFLVCTKAEYIVGGASPSTENGIRPYFCLGKAPVP